MNWFTLAPGQPEWYTVATVDEELKQNTVGGEPKGHMEQKIVISGLESRPSSGSYGGLSLHQQPSAPNYDYQQGFAAMHSDQSMGSTVFYVHRAESDPQNIPGPELDTGTEYTTQIMNGQVMHVVDPRAQQLAHHPPYQQLQHHQGSQPQLQQQLHLAHHMQQQLSPRPHQYQLQNHQPPHHNLQQLHHLQHHHQQQQPPHQHQQPSLLFQQQDDMSQMSHHQQIANLQQMQASIPINMAARDSNLVGREGPDLDHQSVAFQNTMPFRAAGQVQHNKVPHQQPHQQQLHTPEFMLPAFEDSQVHETVPIPGLTGEGKGSQDRGPTKDIEGSPKRARKYKKTENGKIAQQQAQERYRNSDRGKQVQAMARQRWKEKQLRKQAEMGHILVKRPRGRPKGSKDKQQRRVRKPEDQKRPNEPQATENTSALINRIVATNKPPQLGEIRFIMPNAQPLPRV